MVPRRSSVIDGLLPRASAAGVGAHHGRPSAPGMPSASSSQSQSKRPPEAAAGAEPACVSAERKRHTMKPEVPQEDEEDEDEAEAEGPGAEATGEQEAATGELQAVPAASADHASSQSQSLPPHTESEAAKTRGEANGQAEEAQLQALRLEVKRLKSECDTLRRASEAKERAGTDDSFASTPHSRSAGKKVTFGSQEHKLFQGWAEEVEAEQVGQPDANASARPSLAAPRASMLRRRGSSSGTGSSRSSAASFKRGSLWGLETKQKKPTTLVGATGMTPATTPAATGAAKELQEGSDEEVCLGSPVNPDDIRKELPGLSIALRRHDYTPLRTN